MSDPTPPIKIKTIDVAPIARAALEIESATHSWLTSQRIENDYDRLMWALAYQQKIDRALARITGAIAEGEP